jgi:hypothetical protein
VAFLRSVAAGVLAPLLPPAFRAPLRALAIHVDRLWARDRMATHALAALTERRAPGFGLRLGCKPILASQAALESAELWSVLRTSRIVRELDRASSIGVKPTRPPRRARRVGRGFVSGTEGARADPLQTAEPLLAPPRSTSLIPPLAAR